MPTDPIGGVIRNLFQLQRLGNTIGAEAEQLIRELFDDLAAQIARIDPTSPSAAAVRRRRVERLLGTSGELAEDAFEKVRARVTELLVGAGRQQADWASEQLLRSMGGAAIDVRPSRIGRPLIRAIVEEQPFQGLRMREWFGSLEQGTLQQIRRQVQLGMAQNETIDDLVRRVRGTATGAPIRIADGPGKGRIVGYEFSGGVMETTTRQATAIVRTAVNHVANVAHFETYQQNQDVTKQFEYLATLDSRTTLICASLDGKKWGYEDPEAKKPPQHVNCRSSIIPVVDWAGLGLDPPDEGTRASASGQVAGSTSYEGWLKSQPPATQDEILGPSRGRLFRDGKVSLRDMVRTDGRRIPLAELEPE